MNTLLTSWRSAIGKRGVAVIKLLWEEHLVAHPVSLPPELEGIPIEEVPAAFAVATAQAQQQWAQDQFDSRRYLYKYPDSAVRHLNNVKICTHLTCSLVRLVSGPERASWCSLNTSG